MIPMFYNYDWNVVSALNRIEQGNGVSSYCITSPNMNLEYCSRNRFGQSVFKDDFFDGIDLCGDDWDMGLDMVVYLMTFGQSTYITADKSHQGLSCVNGRLAINNNSFTAYSYAAYPSRYFFETLNMSIERGATGFVIKSVTIENGECVRVEVELLNGSNCELTILCEKHNIKNRIYPELVIS